MSNFLSIDLSQNWTIWGAVLIIAFPLLVILLGELAHRFARRGSKFTSLVRFVQHFIMPQLVLLLITTRIIELPEEHVVVKVIETLLWVFIVYATITLFNLLIFSESGGNFQIKAPKLLLDVMRVLIMALGIAIILSSVWGLELGKMMAAFGVGSIVLGLALQDTFSSLFSGFSLVSSRQFKEGDWLEVGDHIGKIVHVTWRTVTLLNRDEDIVIIPNTDLAKGQFVNFSYPYPHHVERVNFDFSFDDAPYKVKQVLIETALDTPGIMSEPAPQVALVSYDEFSVRHEARFWINDYADLPRIRDAYVSRVWYAAKRQGITFPTRSHEVFMMKPPEDEVVTENNLILEALQTSALLTQLDRSELETIANSSSIQPFASGEAIIHQGRSSSNCYLLYSGSAQEHYLDNVTKEHSLNRLLPGDMFGFVGVVRGNADEISVMANGDCEAIVMKSKVLHSVLSKHSELAIILEQMIDSRFRELAALNKLDDMVGLELKS